MDKVSAEEILQENFDFQSLKFIDDGSDTLFLLQREGENLVAKFRGYEGLEKNWFEKEPLILEKLADVLPVPQVLGYCIGVENPYFVMKEMPGEKFSEASENLEEADKLDLIEELGLKLAEIHSTEIDVVDGFGWIVNKKGELYLREENWKEMFQSMISYRLESLKDTEFAEHVDSAEIFVEENFDVIESVENPALIHDDFRPGNILVEENKVSGLLDWARASASDPEYDLVKAMYHFKEEIRINDQRIEEKFLKGYTRVEHLSENFERKKDLYRLCAILGKMTGFVKVWGENYSEEKQKEIKERFKDDLSEIVE